MARNEYAKQWRLENIDHVRAYHKQWRANNKDKVKSSMERYWERKAVEKGGEYDV